MTNKKRLLKKKTTKKKTTKNNPAKVEDNETERVWKGNPEMEPLLVLIDDVKVNPNNARRHSEKDVSGTAASMLDHGQQWPILVQPEDLVIMAGEGRWLAAKKLGWTHIAALASDIKGDGERALFSIRDNRTAELSEWDIPGLSHQLQELNDQFDLPETGLWEDYELKPLLEMDLTPAESGKAAGRSGDDDGGPDMGKSLVLTVEQREVVDRAIAAVREHEDCADISEGKAVELVCGDFLAGPMPGDTE